MNFSLNEVKIIGRLGRDAETKATQNGGELVNLSVATDTPRKDPSQPSGWANDTEWHRVTVFGSAAKRVSGAPKGSVVYVTGKLKTRSWEQDGVKKFSTEIQCFDATVVSRPKTDGAGDGAGSYGGGQSSQPNYASGYGGSQDRGAAPKAPASGGGEFIDDDMPF